MLAYIVRRLLLLPLVLFAVSVLIFAFLSALSPYQRLSFYVNENVLSHLGGDEDWDSLIHQFGLDRPIAEQYVSWMKNVLKGNLGYSAVARMPLSRAIAKYLPASVELALLAAIPILLGAIWMGFFSAEHSGSVADHALRGIAVVGWSLPGFIAGMLLLLVFYGMLPWFPPGRVSTYYLHVVRSPAFVFHTHMMTVDAAMNGEWGLLIDSLRHLVLPVITLSFLSWALLMRVARSSLLNELAQDYVRTARAKGLKETKVNRHARRNSLISVTTVSGMMVAGLLNGVVIIETIFNLPGMGKLMAEGALGLDAVTVLGTAMVNAVILVVANLVVDVLYTFLDPRVRL